MFIDQLRGVTNSASQSYQRVTYLLECLVAVRIYLLVTEISPERLLVELLEMIFEAAAHNLHIRIEFLFKVIKRAGIVATWHNRVL